MAALTYSVREGFRVLTRRTKRLYDRITFENALLLGLFLFVAGLAVFGYIVVVWSEAGFGFGGVSRIREMVVATTLMATGLQTMFGGGLLALLGGEHKPESVAEEAPRKSEPAGQETP
jgi:hypothetical protein